MDPWEALDLDDSDLPSLLRPCKRHQSQQSQLSLDSLPNPNIPSQHCAPTLPPPADNRPPRSLIPGPAGAIQAAMHRIGQGNDDSRNMGCKISTQDYVRRVEEDEAEEFTTDHWLSALDFLSQEGVRRTTCLKDIKMYANAAKIDMVVAVIKGYTPNGLGDVMVVLKDPTDTIQASIHRKVLTEGDYGRQIAVGSVLILQKVSVFSPLEKSCYLNISLSNLVKVIAKDAGREVYSLSNAKDAAPERQKNLKIPDQVSSGHGRTTKAKTDTQLNFDFNGTSYVEKQASGEKSALGNRIFDDQNSNKYASLQQRFRRDRAGSNIMKEPIEVELVSSGQEAVTDKMASIRSSIQPDADLRDKNVFENLDDEHLYAVNASLKQTQVGEQSHAGLLFENLGSQGFGREDGVKTQRQTKENTTIVESSDGCLGETDGLEKLNCLPPSKAPLQEWTDEQLDILDMDDF